MKVKVGFSAVLALIVSGMAHSETLSAPTNTRDFLNACKTETVSSMQASYKLGYCFGIVEGMVSLYFRDNSGTPGFDYNGFIRRASIIQMNMEAKNKSWANYSPTSLILEVFKTVKLEPCNYSKDMCYYGFALFEPEESQKKYQSIMSQ